VRGDCVTWLGEVSRDMPSLIVDAPSTADVSIDGTRAAVAQTVEVDPGAHHVVATDPATHETAATDVTVKLGERNHHVTLQFAASVTPIAPTRKKKAPPFYTWIVGGVGVAGMISFAAWGTSAIVLQNDLRNSCYGSCTAVDVERVHNRALAADVSLAIGVAGLAAFAVIFFWPRYEEVPAAARALTEGIRF